MRVEESIIIDRPPEEVFGFISVRANDPVWMASVTVSEWLDPAAPMAVGRRGRMVMQAMGQREFLDEVTDYEPAGASPTGRCRGRWRSARPASPSRRANGCRATVL